MLLLILFAIIRIHHIVLNLNVVFFIVIWISLMLSISTIFRRISFCYISSIEPRIKFFFSGWRCVVRRRILNSHDITWVVFNLVGPDLHDKRFEVGFLVLTILLYILIYLSFQILNRGWRCIKTSLNYISFVHTNLYWLSGFLATV